MNKNRIAAACVTVVVLASCGKPDASGVYVNATDRDVILVQLVQAPDGKLTGRLEETLIGRDGIVSDKSANADGAISGRDLLLRPESGWYGGVQASGTISGGHLTLAGQGFTLRAERSTLDQYQAAIARLQGIAANERERLATANADRSAKAAMVQAAESVATKQRAIIAGANQLRAYAKELGARIAASPDFARQAAANTARIERMLETAPRLSDVERGQLGVAAGQVEVSTNQIEVARSQYAIGLNQIISDAAPVATALEKFCGSAPPVQFTTQCEVAKSAIAEFRSADMRGRTTFMPYKQQVQAALDRQAALVREIDG